MNQNTSVTTRPERSTEQLLVCSVALDQLSKQRRGVRARLADLSGAGMHREAESLVAVTEAMDAAAKCLRGQS